MAYLSKDARPVATEYIWQEVDPRVFTVIADCEYIPLHPSRPNDNILLVRNSDGLSLSGGLIILQHVLKAPTWADWERWEPLSKFSKVFRDDSVEGYIGIGTEDLHRPISTC